MPDESPFRAHRAAGDQPNTPQAHEAETPGASSDADATEVRRWQAVMTRSDLLSAAADAIAGPELSPAAVARLRKRWDASDVAVALLLAEARRRARSKFAEADRLVCDRQAVEQASGEAVAAWKARRFAVACARQAADHSVDTTAARPGGAQLIWDLCCGMGGDAMALAAVAPRGSEVIAVDRSPLRAWMAATNARCTGRVADVTSLLERGAVAGSLIHCDPARRDEGRGGRTLTPIHEPSLDHCVAIARQAAGAALKLGPGLEPSLLPEEPELEWISERGTLVQLVAWWGELRGADCAEGYGPRRRATLLGPGGTNAVTISGAVEAVPRTDRFAGMLAVPDPALERSRLLGAFARCHGLAEPAAGLGILTAEAIAPSPWLETATVLAEVAFDEHAVVSELARRGATRARVRTRGGVADADRWTKLIATRLSGARPVAGAPHELDCFLLRLGSERRAIIAEPLPHTRG